MTTRISPLAGKPAPLASLVDVARLVTAYTGVPDPSVQAQRVAFGTSGHRGSSLTLSFNERHVVLAITQAICAYLWHLALLDWWLQVHVDGADEGSFGTP